MPLGLRDVYEAERNLVLLGSVVVDEVVRLREEAARRAKDGG